MSPSSVIAPPLSRYSFQLPHLGDCTHEGQPSSHAAGRYEIEGGAHVLLGGLERELGDPGPARITVVDEDRRLAGLRMLRHRDAADVPAIADREQREHSDQPVLGGVHGAEQATGRDAGAFHRFGRNGVPTRAGHERPFRKVEVAYFDHAVRGDLLALVRDHVAADLDRAEVHGGLANLCLALVGDDRDVGLRARHGVFVVVATRHDRDVFAQIEPVDAILLALVEVQRARVRDREDARVVDRADRALLVDVDEVVLDRRSAAETHVGRR